MRLIRSIFVIILLLAALVSVHAEENTVEGELVDITCFAGGASGSGHRMCAIACAKNGQPIGIAAKDGKVYTLLTVSSEMAEYMAKTVKIVGEIHGPSQSIKPTKIFVMDGDKWINVDVPKTI